MIEYVRGELAELTPAQAVVECGGVGYGLGISLNTYAEIQGKKEVKLFVHEAIREDAYMLFGFSTKRERELFLMLTSVSGIGGNTARMILSAFAPDELCRIISSGNDKFLKSVKGIGLKTAQRIIVELKDKVAMAFADVSMAGAAGVGAAVSVADAEKAAEAVAALTMLGFAPAASQKVVQQLLSDDASATVEAVIKSALKML